MLRGQTYAEYYDKHCQLVDEDCKLYLPGCLDALKWGQEEKIMDHGCGTGRVGFKFLVPLAEKYGSKIYAIDISQSMVEHAQKNFPHPRVEYAHTTLLDPKFPYNNVRFDKIFSLFVLMSDPKYKETIAKMYDLLVSGGQALLMVINCNSLFHCHKHIQGHDDWETFSNHLNIPDWHVNDKNPGPHLKAIVEGIGFKANEVMTFSNKFTFASEADCMEFYMSQNPHPFESVLDTDDHHDSLHATYTKFLASGNEFVGEEAEDGGFQISYECVCLTLQKP